MAVCIDICTGNHALIAHIGNDRALIGHIKFASFIRLIGDRTIGGLDKQLCFAIFIHIVKHKLVKVGTRGHFQTHVQSPQRSTVHLIDVKDGRRGRCHSLARVKCIVRIPFYNDFILSIAIHITHAGIIDRIRRKVSVFGGLGFRLLQRDAHIIVFQSGNSLAVIL